jgi:hypothetical protein
MALVQTKPFSDARVPVPGYTGAPRVMSCQGIAKPLTDVKILDYFNLMTEYIPGGLYIIQEKEQAVVVGINDDGPKIISRHLPYEKSFISTIKDVHGLASAAEDLFEMLVSNPSAELQPMYKSIIDSIFGKPEERVSWNIVALDGVVDIPLPTTNSPLLITITPVLKSENIFDIGCSTQKTSCHYSNKVTKFGDVTWYHSGDFSVVHNVRGETWTKYMVHFMGPSSFMPAHNVDLNGNNIEENSSSVCSLMATAYRGNFSQGYGQPITTLLDYSSHTAYVIPFTFDNEPRTVFSLGRLSFYPDYVHFDPVLIGGNQGSYPSNSLNKVQELAKTVIGR